MTLAYKKNIILYTLDVRVQIIQKIEKQFNCNVHYFCDSRVFDSPSIELEKQGYGGGGSIIK